jgi:hypothetical protein
MSAAALRGKTRVGGGGENTHSDGLSQLIDESGQAAIGNTKRTVGTWSFNRGHTMDSRTAGQAKRRRGTFFNATDGGCSKTRDGENNF